ncbi:DUF3363 domain-containing protein [Methylocystis sp. B8]|uniref:DUF3363 domain-containing protein n=1 Tax=Methylocystis sp. B8 TaxID=544938 RepID=UPI001FEF303E|nr:DUF3363 domain-containing protein [Methylocystis sp. B8]
MCRACSRRRRRRTDCIDQPRAGRVAAPSAAAAPRASSHCLGGVAWLVLAVRSALSLKDQIHANGATWLDRRLFANEPLPILEAGLGLDVSNAVEAEGVLSPKDLLDDSGSDSSSPTISSKRCALAS